MKRDYNSCANQAHKASTKWTCAVERKCRKGCTITVRYIEGSCGISIPEYIEAKDKVAKTS